MRERERLKVNRVVEREIERTLKDYGWLVVWWREIKRGEGYVVALWVFHGEEREKRLAIRERERFEVRGLEREGERGGGRERE